MEVYTLLHITTIALAIAVIIILALFTTLVLAEARLRKFGKPLFSKRKTPITNREHFNQMSDGEFMKETFLLCKHCTQKSIKNPECDGQCEQNIIAWLKQPYQEEKDGKK